MGRFAVSAQNGWAPATIGNGALRTIEAPGISFKLRASQADLIVPRYLLVPRYLIVARLQRQLLSTPLSARQRLRAPDVSRCQPSSTVPERPRPLAANGQTAADLEEASCSHECVSVIWPIM